MAALLVTQKTVLSRYHPTVVVTWYYSLGSLITLVVCLAKQTPLANYALSSDIKPWLALGYAALFGTAFNYNVYSWAGTVVAPGIIAIYSTIQPIGTGLFSFIVFGTQPTWGEILCGILVVAGLVLTVTARSIEDKMRKKPVLDLKHNGDGVAGQTHAAPSQLQPVGPNGGDRA
jgi:drug/metabolite transporter (DMT)-like permease